MKKTLDTIKKHLQSSSNILYFFDDDPDGLSAYLLFFKAFGGKGIVAKDGPILDKSCLRKCEEYAPDLVVILDKAIVDQEFLDGLKCPCIWIDHHPIENRNKVIYFNPKLWNKEDNRCTTYWAYEIAGGPVWIAAVGITSDWFLPEFISELKKQYPSLITSNPKSPPDLLFNSKLGDLVKIFMFALKGSSFEIKKTINCLTKINDPMEILEGSSPPGKFIKKRADKLNKEYNELMKEAESKVSKDKLMLFTYKDRKTSYTSFLSNELLYKYPNKLILLGREKNGEVKISIRYYKPVADKMIKKALSVTSPENYGGGHPNAVGGCIKKRDFTKFIDSIKEQLKNEV